MVFRNFLFIFVQVFMANVERIIKTFGNRSGVLPKRFSTPEEANLYAILRFLNGIIPGVILNLKHLNTEGQESLYSVDEVQAILEFLEGRSNEVVIYLDDNSQSNR